MDLRLAMIAFFWVITFARKTCAYNQHYYFSHLIEYVNISPARTHMELWYDIPKYVFVPHGVAAVLHFTGGEKTCNLHHSPNRKAHQSLTIAAPFRSEGSDHVETLDIFYSMPKFDDPDILVRVYLDQFFVQLGNDISGVSKGVGILFRHGFFDDVCGMPLRRYGGVMIRLKTQEIIRIGTSRCGKQYADLSATDKDLCIRDLCWKAIEYYHRPYNTMSMQDKDKIARVCQNELTFPDLIADGKEEGYSRVQPKPKYNGKDPDAPPKCEDVEIKKVEINQGSVHAKDVTGANAVYVGISHDIENYGSTELEIPGMKYQISHDQSSTNTWKVAGKFESVTPASFIFGGIKYEVSFEEGGSTTKTKSEALEFTTTRQKIAPFSRQRHRFLGQVLSYEMKYWATVSYASDCVGSKNLTGTLVVHGVIAKSEIRQISKFDRVVPVECKSPFSEPFDSLNEDFCVGGPKCADNALCVRWGVQKDVCCEEEDMWSCCASSRAHPDCDSRYDSVCPTSQGYFLQCCNMERSRKELKAPLETSEKKASSRQRNPDDGQICNEDTTSCISHTFLNATAAKKLISASSKPASSPRTAAKDDICDASVQSH